ncbi:MAG: PH domain-containing protein [Candidatus Bathyarchaeia archaeon]
MEAAELTQKHVSLHQDEKVLMRLQRRYPSIFSSILSTVVFMFFVYWWSIFRYIIQYSGFLAEALFTLLYAVIAFTAGIFILIALVGYFYVKGHLYILTDKRIIMFRKFITVSVRELAYNEITDIIVNQGPIARWLNYGSIIPLSPGVRGPYALPYPYIRRASYARVELKDVSNPMKIAGELFNLARTQSLG